MNDDRVVQNQDEQKTDPGSVPRLEDLGHTRARLAAIVDSSEDAIVSKTLDGVVTSWNAAAERVFGWKAEEMIGQPTS